MEIFENGRKMTCENMESVGGKLSCSVVLKFTVSYLKGSGEG